MNTNEKGAIAEMAIALEAVRHGIGVLKPLSAFCECSASGLGWMAK